MPTTRRCGGSSSSRAAVRRSSTPSPIPPPSTSTSSPADRRPRLRRPKPPRPGRRRPERNVMITIDTVVIGAGHAGLAVSRLLTDVGRDHVVLDRGGIGDRWRTERWDSLHLLTPNWKTRLPGQHSAALDPEAYLSAGRFIAFLEQYAKSFGAPVVAGTTVLEVSEASAGYRVVTDG